MHRTALLLMVGSGILLTAGNGTDAYPIVLPYIYAGTFSLIRYTTNDFSMAILIPSDTV